MLCSTAPRCLFRKKTEIDGGESSNTKLGHYLSKGFKMSMLSTIDPEAIQPLDEADWLWSRKDGTFVKARPPPA